MSKIQDPVSVSVSPRHFFCIGNSFGNHDMTCTQHFSYLLAQTSCTVQLETNYGGNDLNDGYTDQEMLYVGSCQSFCESKYPSSTHYTLVTPRIGSWSSNTAAYNTCWCKSANGGAGHTSGMIAGETYCAGIKCSDKSYSPPCFIL